VFIFLLVLFLPTQLAKHFWPELAFLWGIRVDYLSPTIYFSEVLLLSLIIANIKNLKKWLRPAYWWLVVFAGLNILLADNPLVSAIKWWKLAELFLLVLIISKTKVNLKKAVFLPLLISLTVVSLLALAQFLRGATLGGVFYYLGERTFSKTTVGISLLSIFGREFLRPYSTFSHPNSLAGYLLVGTCLLLAFKPKLLRWKRYLPILLLIIIAFVLTASRGAFVAGLLLFIIFFLKNWNSTCFRRSVLAIYSLTIMSSLTILFLSNCKLQQITNPRINERISLVNIASRVVEEHPVFGVGVNNFLLEIPKRTPSLKTGWLLQPVHNIFLLCLAEAGVVGLVLICCWLLKAIGVGLEKNNTFLILAVLGIIISGTLDHYWLTLWQNMLLLALTLGLTFRKQLS